MWKRGRRHPGQLAPRLLAVAGAGLLAVLSLACGNDKDKVTLGLIVKRESNPFFVKIEDTAKDTAGDDNVKLLTAAGKSDIDNRTQVAALAKMTAEGAKGILITPANSSAIVPAIEKARRAGVNVIALDTPTRPRSAVNALYATDNFELRPHRPVRQGQGQGGRHRAQDRHARPGAGHHQRPVAPRRLPQGLRHQGR
jgi:ABC-type sugar transport system substrate-binding protein